MALQLTAAQVKQALAALDENAPDLTNGQLSVALDWAEEMLQLGGVPEPDPATRQGRAFARAVAAHAVAVKLGLAATSGRMTASAASTKKVEVGPIKLEKAVLDSATAATNIATSAEDWEALAGQFLFQAGIPLRRGFAGVAL